MKRPNSDPSVFLAPGAVVRGDVTLHKNVSVWYNAVMRGDWAPITVGEDSNIQDNAVVHVDKDFPVTVGRRVTVGHGAILHGCTVGDEALIGMGAVVLNGAVIGEGCIVGAGALVTAGTVLPPDSLAVGCPAKVKRLVTPQEREDTRQNALHYVQAAREYKQSEE